MGSPDQYEDLRRGVREVCADFPDGYWRELDARREYPEDFIEAMTTVLLPNYKHRRA